MTSTIWPGNGDFSEKGITGLSEIIIDGNGQIPQDEYLQLRAAVCHDAYHVATSSHQLILFSLYSDTNEGPVISTDDAGRIFEPFVRLSPDEHSLGIGLPLARRLALSMGYNITLDMDYTDGARFVVTGI